MGQWVVKESKTALWYERL